MKRTRRILLWSLVLILGLGLALRWLAVPYAARQLSAALEGVAGAGLTVELGGHWNLDLRILAPGQTLPVLQTAIAPVPLLVDLLFFQKLSLGPVQFSCPAAADTAPSADLRELLQRPVFIPALGTRQLVLKIGQLQCHGIEVSGAQLILQQSGGMWSLLTQDLVVDVAGWRVPVFATAVGQVDGSYSVRLETGGSFGPLQISAGELMAELGRAEPKVYGALNIDKLVLPMLELSGTLRLNQAQQAGLILPVEVELNQDQQSLKLSGEIDAFKQTGSFRVAGDLTLGPAQATRLTSTINLTKLWPLTIPNGQPLSIAALQLGGLPLTSVSARYGFAENTLRIQKGSALLFGGRVELSATRVPLPPEKVEAVLTLAGLEISQLVQLGNVDGLYGEGRLSGQVPLRYENGKLTISPSEMNAEFPGHIRYQPVQMPSFMAPGGSGEMLGQVFSDFAYDGLSLKMGGTLGDNLTLGVRLAGKNPTFYNGHPVVFNLNLSGALESLLTQGLQSFRFTPEALGELVREGAKP
jgi:hypothetical protein